MWGARFAKFGRKRLQAQRTAKIGKSQISSRKSKEGVVAELQTAKGKTSSKSA